jgi:fibronectin type 3 domain-containing protein
VSASHSVALSWLPSSSAVGYNVYSSSVSGGPYMKLTSNPMTATTYTDLEVQPAQTRYYVVTAIDSSNVESVFSNEAPATIP